MNPAFLRAVVDALLPAEADPPADRTPLRSGTAAGVDLARYPEEAQPVLEIIAARSGGETAFLAAAPEARAESILAVEDAAPQALQSLLSRILPDYYEQPAVLSAFGWTIEPPQPHGHALAEMDPQARAALERVRRRGKIWRG